MNTVRTLNLIAVMLIGALALANTGVHAEDINTRIGTLSFTHDFANGYRHESFHYRNVVKADSRHSTHVFSVCRADYQGLTVDG
jgi:hypothetical protein